MLTNPLWPTKQQAATLEPLMRAIQLARDDVQARRSVPGAHELLRSARHSLLTAMEAYADELTARRLPIPPKLRDELRLQRQVRRARPGSR
jgi:hypothetical protein